MNEELVKNIVKYKLAVGEKILDRLLPDVSNSLKDLGRIIFESISESLQEVNAQPAKKAKSNDKLNNINIE
jgi:hypothetical protein